MGSLLAFPLAQPIGGVAVSNIRTTSVGGDQWFVEWDPIVVAWDSAYMVFVDGKLHSTLPNQTSMYIDAEPGADPIIQIAQIAGVWMDPGRAVPGYFPALQPNKIKIEWDKPASVVDVESYRVFGDSGTGTVDFDNPLFSDIPEDGSASYEFVTDQLVTGTYKFVVRTVDEAGNESATIAEFTRALTTYPGIVTAEAIVFNSGPITATLTWVDPADIAAGDVKVFSNGGVTADQFPDYETGAEIATIAAGVQTFTTAALADGIHIFGLRVNNGTLDELNTSVILFLRIESGAEVSNFPVVPQVQATPIDNGKVELIAYVDPPSTQTNPDFVAGEAVKVQFFTNDGAGGAIDFGTPLGVGFVNLTPTGVNLVARLETIVFGETARKFAARSYTSGGVASTDSDEVTITPDATKPPDPLNVVTSTVRD